jgi:methylated-DNA-protein-cysteine methyltransferase-like protein
MPPSKTKNVRKTSQRKARRAAASSAAASHSPTPEELIIAAVKRIPRGRVSTYGAIADVAGLPRRARLVGTVLKHTSAKDLPWFRVINSSGRISLPSGSDAYRVQKRKLEGEGVIFRGDRVDMKRYGWPDRERDFDELFWKL